MTASSISFPFHGRLRRRTFWLRALGASIAFVVLYALLDRLAGRTSTLLIYPPFFWAVASLAVRRLHDRDKSPRWLALLLVPLLGPLWIALELLLLRGTRGDNRYGPAPVSAR